MDKSPKIIISNYTLEPNGLTTTCVRWANALAQEGAFHVRLLSYYRTDQDIVDSITALGLNVDILGRKKLFDQSYQKPLNLYFQRNPSDILIATSRRDIKAAINNEFITRIIFRINSDASIFSEVYRHFHQHPKIKWVSNTKETIRNFPDKEKISIIPNWVEMSPTACPKKLTPPIGLIYTGRLDEPTKRVSDLVKLAAILKQKGVNFHLTIAGQGPEKTKLKKSIRSQRLESYLTLSGFYANEKFPELYKNQHLFIHCAHREALSNSIIEAMSQGIVPIAAKSAGGIHDLVMAQMTGEFFPIGDAQACAQKILAILKQPSAYEQMSRQCINHIQNNFSKNQIFEKLKTLVLNQPAQTGSKNHSPANSDLSIF